MDLMDSADEELPAAKAAVKRSKAAAVTARMDLDKRQEWLGQHQELYAEVVKGCERSSKAPGIYWCLQGDGTAPDPTSY
jgi:hypothetical protein